MEAPANGTSTTREATEEDSRCFAITESALRNGRELMFTPGTKENGRRRTGREDARMSEKQVRIYEILE
jgi:hypothetical protein